MTCVYDKKPNVTPNTTEQNLIVRNNKSEIAITKQVTMCDHWSDWKSDHELSTEVLIVRDKERATKRWLISDEIRWLNGK